MFAAAGRNSSRNSSWAAQSASYCGHTLAPSSAPRISGGGRGHSVDVSFTWIQTQFLVGAKVTVLTHHRSACPCSLALGSEWVWL